MLFLFLFSFFVFFWEGAGQGGLRGRDYVGGVLSLVYRVNLLFVADVMYYGVDPGGRQSSADFSSLCGSGRICHMDGTETRDTFSLFLY